MINAKKLDAIPVFGNDLYLVKGVKLNSNVVWLDL